MTSEEKLGVEIVSFPTTVEVFKYINTLYLSAPIMKVGLLCHFIGREEFKWCRSSPRNTVKILSA